MLPFFPTPLPDELFYSICARYHQRSGHTSVGYTLQDLFGSRHSAAVIDLPTRLRSLVEELSPETLNTSEQLISANTLLPLYWPFLPIKRVEQVIRIMIGSQKGNVHMTVGQTASSVPAIKFLRYCQSCMQDDERDYREPYWHRSHQVTGVRICHLHKEWLLDSTVAVGGIGIKHVFVPLGHDVLAHRWPLREVRDIHHYYWLATTVHWLLNCNQHEPPLGLEELHRRYLHYLHLLNLVSAGGRLASREIIKNFQVYYGEDFLADLHCTLTSSTDNWLLTLLRKPRKASHPLHHLLLIRFLGLELDEFLRETPIQYHPFGRGPWPCLNPAASHFRRAVVGTCTITRNSETRAPVGTFSCKCGFTYSRSGPDQSHDDRSRIGRLVAVGTVWEKCLLNLIQTEKKSFRETARQLGVDIKTVQRRLARLMKEPSEPEFAPDNACLDSRRARWQKLCAANPGMGVKELRLSGSADYAWLYRNEHIWLQSHVPRRQKRTAPKGKVNWQKRDALLAAQIATAVTTLRQRQDRPVRITANAIGKQLGDVDSLQKKLDLLPNTRAILVSVVETKDEFAIRRLRLAAEKLRQKGEPLLAWKLVRIAGLRPGYPDSVAHELDRIVSDKEDRKLGSFSH